MRRFAGLSICLIVLVLGRGAEAGPLFYNLTDLGTDPKILSAPDGTIYGVTATDGSATYAFDKTPAIVTTSPGVAFDNGELEILHYTVTFKFPDATYTVGYDSGPNTIGQYYGRTDNGWFSRNPGGIDMNLHGQMTGTTNGGNAAAITDPQGNNLPPPPGVSSSQWWGQLTSEWYTPPAGIPGFYLKGTPRIDDLGRLLVQGGTEGSTGDPYYLLTPVSMGSPQTIPEPTTLLMVGGGLGALVARGSGLCGAGRRVRMGA